MSAESDFHHSLDRAAGLAVDAACACRAARRLPLPADHRRALTDALDELDAAQQSLFEARNHPWPKPAPPPPARPLAHRQLQLN